MKEGQKSVRVEAPGPAPLGSGTLGPGPGSAASAEAPTPDPSVSAQPPAAGSRVRPELVADEVLMAEFRETLAEPLFEELARRYGPRGYRMARAILGQREAAQDAVQESFLQLLRARARFDPRRSFAVWFFTILRNICHDRSRKRGDPPSGATAVQEPSPDSGLARAALPPLELLAQGEVFEQACRALGRIPRAEAEAVVLRVCSGVGFGMLAEICGITEDLAKKRVYRGLDRLRRELGAEPRA